MVTVTVMGMSTVLGIVMVLNITMVRVRFSLISRVGLCVRI